MPSVQENLPQITFNVAANFFRNSAKEIWKQVSNLRQGRSPVRSGLCLIGTLASAAGAIPLCLLVPEIHNYFTSWMRPALPSFLGNTVVEDILISLIAFLLGGSTGFTLLKGVYRQFSLQVNGHTNDEYTITDTKMREIIEANPHLYSYESNQEGNLTPESESKKERDMVRLKTTLIDVRNDIDRFKLDTTDPASPGKKIICKVALLNALHQHNLDKLNELISNNINTQNTKIASAFEKEKYLTGVSLANGKSDHDEDGEVEVVVDEEVSREISQNAYHRPAFLNFFPRIGYFYPRQNTTEPISHKETVRLLQTLKSEKELAVIEKEREGLRSLGSSPTQSAFRRRHGF